MKHIISIILTSTIALTINIPSSWAQDPFRTNSSVKIDKTTETAFDALFKDGNYKEAYRQLLESNNDINDPLAHAMRASLAYTNRDWMTLKTYADRTLETAKNSTNISPLRAKIYSGVGIFLQAAHGLAIVNNDPLKGGVAALSKLSEVFSILDEAAKMEPNDPELNLIKGYMDLMIAVNLPFSNPNDAIEKLKLANPKYLVDRGLALGYRDLKKYDQALEYVNKALEQTPNNPEVHYLKAQILIGQGDLKAAQESFRTALSRSEQLPKYTVAQIFREYCRNQNKIDSKSRSCNSLRDQIRSNQGNWGPKEVPKLEV